MEPYKNSICNNKAIVGKGSMGKSFIEKYRPNSLDEVIGHDDIKHSLEVVLKKNEARAFFFYGPAGVGKTTLARIIAKENNSGEIIEIDAASYNGVEQIKQVIETSKYTSFGNKPNKTIILDEVHRLSQQAWSVLLKPIEEPNEFITWVLCTTDHEKVPQTIKTRCCVFALKPLNDDLIYNYLCEICIKEKLAVDEDILDLIALKCEGSVRQSLSFLNICQDCKSRGEASGLISNSIDKKEIIDLARLLVTRKGLTWKNVAATLKKLRHENPDSIRLVITNYAGAILLNGKDDDWCAFIIDSLNNGYYFGQNFSVLVSRIYFVVKELEQ